MSHSIATIDGTAAMAYAGETPWHGLGVKAESIEDVDSALKLANLDWEVKLYPMFVNHPIGATTSQLTVPNRHAVVRMTSRPAVLGTVSSNYTPLQNRPAFEVLDLACREFGVKIETAGALHNGALVWMLVKLPTDIEVIDGDRVSGYFLLSTGHDGATPYTARATPVRVVCWNTIQLAMRDKAVIRLTHTTNAADKLKMVERMIADLVKTMIITGETFTKMAQRRMTEDQLKQYIDTVLGIEDASLVTGIVAKRRARLIELAYHGKGAELSPNSLWNGYNAFTEYIDHVRPGEVNPAKKLKAQESALFGANAALKARALSVAEELIDA